MREKSFLPVTLATCAILSLLFWQLVYVPVRAEISAMKLEAQRLQMQAKELEKFQARYGNLADYAEKMDERLKLAREFLPTTIDDEKFIDSLHRAAEGKKVLINSVLVSEIPGDEIERHAIRVRLDADYISLLNFIREVLDGGRLVTLENFSMEGSGILFCELEFDIFATKK